MTNARNIHTRFNINDSTLHRFIIEVRNASRSLKRDWFELESMQAATSASAQGFLQRAIIKTYQELSGALSDQANEAILASELFNVTHDLGESFLVIEPLDSPINFSRALPFFALSVTKVTKQKTNNIDQNSKLIATHSLFYLPILDEMYYTSVGKGVVMEKLGTRSDATKLKLQSKKREIALTYSATNDINLHSSLLDMKRNVINCLSPMYHLSLLLKSNLDLMTHCYDDLDCYFRIAASLFIQEAGGVIKDASNVCMLAGTDAYFP